MVMLDYLLRLPKHGILMQPSCPLCPISPYQLARITNVNAELPFTKNIKHILLIPAKRDPCTLHKLTFQPPFRGIVVLTRAE